MLTDKIWLHYIGSYPFDVVRMGDCLTTVGERTVLLECNSTVKGWGVIFFNECNEPLLRFVRDCSNESRERIVVVAIDPSNLSQGESWNLLRAGASDVLILKNYNETASVITDKFKRWRKIEELLNSELVSENLIGRSPVWIATLRQILEVAQFTDSSILITGESGTGKELVSRLIHTIDQRTDKGELVILDCSSIMPELSGSEFFGHERGAFTGAVSVREGAFALADKGTLFLDEVGELPLRLQGELLRVIQEGMYKKVGCNMWQHTKFRLICATNRDLKAQQANGNFRLDFYYRIAAWSCRLPSLNERRQDIIPLVEYFITRLRPDGKALEIGDDVRHFFLTRSYPGNVRDLRQLVTRIMSRHVGNGPITVGDIPPEERPQAGEKLKSWHETGLWEYIAKAVQEHTELKDISRITEDMAIRIALEETEGKVQAAAKLLGVTDRTVQLRKASWRTAETI